MNTERYQSSPLELKERIKALSRMLIKSFSYAEADPETFLLNARKTTETICKFIYNKEIGDESSKKLMLNDLGHALVNQKVIPERIGILIGTIQTYGNYGSHAQDDLSETSHEWIAPCQTALASLSNWFFLEYLKGQIPEELSVPLKDHGSAQSAAGYSSSTVIQDADADGTETADIQYNESNAAKSADAIRMAILYFDNNQGEAKLQGLSKGLADMLITDLSKYYMLQVVERDKLEAILKEQELSNSRQFDQATAVKIGKLLGAQCIMGGSYFEMSGSFRIDARLIDVETGKIIRSDGVTGSSSQFFNLEKDLANKIILGLEITLRAEEENLLKSQTAKNLTFTASLQYSEALDLMDKGETDKAKELLALVLKDNPDFEPAKKAFNQIKQ